MSNKMAACNDVEHMPRKKICLTKKSNENDRVRKNASKLQEKVEWTAQVARGSNLMQQFQ